MIKTFGIFSTLNCKFVDSFPRRFFFDVMYCKKRPMKYINHDPPYLRIKRKIPIYDVLQIKLSSLDFALLENYEKFIVRWLKRFNFKFENYPIPHTSQQIDLYVPRSTKVMETIQLNNYCRLIDIFKVETTKLPMMLEVFMSLQPEAVDFSIDKPSTELEDFRYVPELEKEILKKQLDIIDKNN